MLALITFAANSVLCRLALGENTIDAASFTTIRLLSGIVVLAIIVKLKQGKSAMVSKGSWKASFMLFIYAVTFSFAYLSLETEFGALILFASVQITMILTNLFQGQKLNSFERLGMIIAFSGFVYLFLPSIGSPSLIGFMLMTISGIAWGFYSLFGGESKKTLSDTAFNFIRTWPLLIILLIFTFAQANLSEKGILLAVLSGGLASGVGYTIWYMALKGLSTAQAAIVQLLVPIIAAIGGVIFSHEVFSLRLAIASASILGGVLIVVIGKNFTEKQVIKTRQPNNYLFADLTLY